METFPTKAQAFINNIEWSTRLKFGGILFGILAFENIPPAPHNEDDMTLTGDMWAERDEKTGKYTHKLSNIFSGTIFTALIASYVYKTSYESLTSKEKQEPLTTLEKAGLAVALFGFGLRSLSKIWLGRYFTYTVSVKKDNHNVVDTGPYAIVRHPSYTGIVLEWAGLCMYWRLNLLISGWYGLGTMWLGERIRNEEKFLLNIKEKSNEPERVAFAQNYAKYLEKVKYRCVPFIW